MSSSPLHGKTLLFLITSSVLLTGACSGDQESGSTGLGNDTFTDDGGVSSGGTNAALSGSAGGSTFMGDGATSGASGGTTGTAAGGNPAAGGSSAGASCVSDNDCVDGQCLDGACECWDQQAEVCGGQCTRVQGDPENCGACGVTCDEPGSNCNAGQCFCNGTPCESSQTGTGGTAGTGGANAGTGTCSAHADCGAGQGCIDGACQCWSGDQKICGDSCQDVRWNDQNCGECGNACPSSAPSCNDGQCVCYSGNCGGGNNGSGGANNGSGGSNNGSGGSNNGSGGTTGGGGEVGPPGSCTGYATRFWDCCKPHCSWSGNTPGNVSPANTCDSNDNVQGDPGQTSACQGGGAHTCHGMTPWAVSANLSYGYAATSSGDVCGRCFQVDFTGSSHNGGADAGSAALAGKTMVVQALNIGYDVGGGQFDLMVPGGGVGLFNACSAQWGVNNNDLGAQYGGFLETCKSDHGRNQSNAFYKQCVRDKCDAVFTDARGLSELRTGCHWFADWFEAADNPNLTYREVECPSALTDASGMDRRPVGDIRQTCGN